MIALLQKKAWQFIMADSKKKKAKHIKEPLGNHIAQKENPEAYYSEKPSWNFSSCDMEKWSLYSPEVQQIFWDEILSHFRDWETQTWREILVSSKKQNHSIDTAKLNKAATDRLAKLYVEAESLVSLRLQGTHRIYGHMRGSVFNILWIDLNHGDNTTCVCRSHKKHT